MCVARPQFPFMCHQSMKNKTKTISVYTYEAASRAFVRLHFAGTVQCTPHRTYTKIDWENRKFTPFAVSFVFVFLSLNDFAAIWKPASLSTAYLSSSASVRVWLGFCMRMSEWANNDWCLLMFFFLRLLSLLCSHRIFCASKPGDIFPYASHMSCIGAHIPHASCMNIYGPGDNLTRLMRLPKC